MAPRHQTVALPGLPKIAKFHCGSATFNHRQVFSKSEPTRELRGDKQKDPPSAFAPGPVGGRVHALAWRSAFNGAACAHLRPSVTNALPKAMAAAHAQAPSPQEPWRCAALTL